VAAQAETISKSGSETKGGDDLGNLTKLTNDVLKQAEASLAAFIGAVEYSSTFAVAAAATHQSVSPVVPYVEGVEVPPGGAAAPAATSISGSTRSSPLFDLTRLQTCVDHANNITKTYGVSITSINVVSAVPADKTLMVSLAQGAVAAAEAVLRIARTEPTRSLTLSLCAQHRRTDAPTHRRTG
jgi:hypothetical protein